MDWARQLTAQQTSRSELVDALRVRTGRQRAGRGRRGAPWWDSPGDSVLTTLAIRRTGRWDPGDRNPASLALRAGIAVSRTLESFDVAGVGIKWPNDIYMNDRKVCGILVEADPRWFYVGIGLNMGSPSIPMGAGGDRSSAPPGDVSHALPSPVGLHTVVSVLDRCLAEALHDSHWGDAVRRRLLWMGADVHLERPSEPAVFGVLTGIDDDGAVLIRDPSHGTESRYVVGTLRVGAPS